MKSKVFYENNKTIVICQTNDNHIIVEVFDYSSKQEKYYICFNYYNSDFDFVVELYKNDLLLK